MQGGCKGAGWEAHWEELLAQPGSATAWGQGEERDAHSPSPSSDPLFPLGQHSTWQRVDTGEWPGLRSHLPRFRAHRQGQRLGPGRDGGRKPTGQAGMRITAQEEKILICREISEAEGSLFLLRAHTRDTHDTPC